MALQFYSSSQGTKCRTSASYRLRLERAEEKAAEAKESPVWRNHLWGKGKFCLGELPAESQAAVLLYVLTLFFNPWLILEKLGWQDL